MNDDQKILVTQFGDQKLGNRKISITKKKMSMFDLMNETNMSR
jgi:hypothetical protein